MITSLRKALNTFLCILQHTFLGLFQEQTIILLFTYTYYIICIQHVSYHGRHSEVTVVHVLGQPIHFTTSVAEDDSLSDTQCIIQIAQCLQLPIFTLNKYKELLDTCNRIVNKPQCKITICKLLL